MLCCHKAQLFVFFSTAWGRFMSGINDAHLYSSGSCWWECVKGQSDINVCNNAIGILVKGVDYHFSSSSDRITPLHTHGKLKIPQSQKWILMFLPIKHHDLFPLSLKVLRTSALVHGLFLHLRLQLTDTMCSHHSASPETLAPTLTSLRKKDSEFKV